MTNLIEDKLSLCVLTPSGRMTCILISDDKTLIDTLDPSYRDGVIWITVPAAGEAVGPIALPQYLAHQTGNNTSQELAALAAKRGDVTKLPPCRPSNGTPTAVGNPEPPHRAEMPATGTS
jgi:hypothetical protein